MKYIIQVDSAQQTAALDAQREWNLAQAREGKAKADYDEMTTRLTAARNDRSKAKLEIDTALSNKKLPRPRATPTSSTSRRRMSARPSSR